MNHLPWRPAHLFPLSAPRLSASTGWLALGLLLLIALPRLTALNQYLIVDEADRWRWAKDFVTALSQGDLAGTLVGDGYPGIVPVWAESLWILLEAGRRSLLQGQWLGPAGLYQLFHEWDRPAYLMQQRLPIVLLNTVLALAIVGAVWRLYGKGVALVSGILIALDPFYLSDSRVNRAEALITGLMTLSVITLIFYQRWPRRRYVIISGILGGLSFLTKIQALALLPAIVLISLYIHSNRQSQAGSTGTPPFSSLLPASRPYFLLPTSYSLLLWSVAAALTWFILWPSMWVKPLETLTLVYEYTTRKVGAEGVNLFFMGQTYADADPGLIFYPFVLLMRLTPLALLGLIFYGLQAMYHVRRATSTTESNPVTRDTMILIIYILVYALVMTLGSHKQDRYLMPIFVSLDILAGIGLVQLWAWLKGVGRTKVVLEAQERKSTPYFLLPTSYSLPIALITLITLQLATVWPHHPYYYSYFNPLLGGGYTAVRTMRIGWGEGMDQVGAYLAAKPNSRELVVSTRFTHNMLGFKGDLISLLPDGRWTQADYIVLYIQQVQRRQEPGPGFIDYFLARQPEQVITIGGIDYAWIYPIPFTTPANPTLSLIPQQAALLGYRWETRGQAGESGNHLDISSDLPIRPFAHSQLRLLWENLGLADTRPLVVRLAGDSAQTEWAACSPDPAFAAQAKTPGAFVESVCAPTAADLPAGTYTVEFGLASGDNGEGGVESFTFPQGWQAVTLTAAGALTDTPEPERLAAIARQALPSIAPPLDRVYDGRLKLVAYRLNPVSPQPGQTVQLVLYWQAVKEASEPRRLTVQLADNRTIGLGRLDSELPVDRWLLGEIKTTTHNFTLAPNLDPPLAGQIEVTLWNQAEVALPPTTLAGQALEAAIARFTIAPEQWPTPGQTRPVQARWQNGLTLSEYTVAPQPVQPGQTLSVTLYWQASQPIAESYAVFVHLLDQTGQITTQNDDLPRAGAYPTPWWPPGLSVADIHPLVLPAHLPAGAYQLVVGFYRPADGRRLPLLKGGDSFTLGTIDVK
jgi:hypothetical protein